MNNNVKENLKLLVDTWDTDRLRSELKAYIDSDSSDKLAEEFYYDLEDK